MPYFFKGIPKTNRAFLIPSIAVGASLTMGYILRDLFSEKKANSIIVTQNSGAFTLYSFLASNMLVSKDKSGKSVLVSMPFWLDQVHSSRLATPWGQNFREYPPAIRKKIEMLYPEVKQQERLTFAQMKELRSVILNEIKQDPHCMVIKGECKEIKFNRSIAEKFDERVDHLFDFYPVRYTAEESSHTEVSDEIQLYMNNGKKYKFEIGNDFILYNLATKPRVNKLIERLYGDGRDLPPQTILYSYKKGYEPKNIIIFGSGLSVVWVCEQAEASKVYIVLKDRMSKLPPEIKRNEKIKIKEDQLLYADEVDFQLLTSCLYDKAQTELEEKRKQSSCEYIHKNGMSLSPDKIDNFLVAFKADSAEVLIIAASYNAIGFEPNKSLVASLPLSLVKNIHFDRNSKFYAPKNIPGGALLDRHNEQFRQISREKDSLIFIDLEIPFIREEDKAPLAEALGVDIRFMDYLCNEIKFLEDTPENTSEFIKEKFSKWLEKENISADIETTNQFNERLAYFFERKVARYCEKKAETVLSSTTSLKPSI